MTIHKANYQNFGKFDASEWKPVPLYEGLYEIHWRGVVRNAVTKHNLRAGLGGVGYYTVNLKKDGNAKSYSIHRLNMIAHVPNIENKEMVNHIDGVKTNNHLANLEWATRSENEKHGHSMGLKKPPLDRKPVIQMDMLGNEIKRFTSSTEAELDGFRSGNILHVCNGKRSQHGGFKWKYDL